MSTNVIAVDADTHDPAMLDAIHNMRMKQQDEENSARRVVQQITVEQRSFCTPEQKIQARLGQVGAKTGSSVGNINLNAGHKDVKVDGNKGSIDNSVNVQIVNPNDENNCF